MKKELVIPFKELVMPFILGMLDPILKLIACILIGIFVPGSLWLEIVYMVGANAGVSLAGLGVKKIHTTFKKRFKRKNINEEQQNFDQNVIYASTSDGDNQVKVETCVEYSSQQIDEILDDNEVSEQDRPQILSLKSEKECLQEQITFSKNKEELRLLKQSLILIEFTLQDLLENYNHTAQYEEKNEKVKNKHLE